AVEPSHRAAVILLDNAHEELGYTVGGSRQVALVIQLQPGRISVIDHLGNFRHAWHRFRRGGELPARAVDTPRHFEGVEFSVRRTSDRAEPGLELDAETDQIEHSLACWAGGHIFFAF